MKDYIGAIIIILLIIGVMGYYWIQTDKMMAIMDNNQTISELSFADNSLNVQQAISSGGLVYKPTLEQISICFSNKVTDIQIAQLKTCEAEDFKCLTDVMVEVCQFDYQVTQE